MLLGPSHYPSPLDPAALLTCLCTWQLAPAGFLLAACEAESCDHPSLQRGEGTCPRLQKRPVAELGTNLHFLSTIPILIEGNPGRRPYQPLAPRLPCAWQQVSELK